MTEAGQRTAPRKVETATGRRSRGRKEAPGQLDLFVTFVGDVPLRDDREAMSLPLVSLSKRKRIKPIEWRSKDQTRYVKVSAVAEIGMATIWDLDVIVWALSQLNAAVEAGQSVSAVLRFQPYEMLRAIGRTASGSEYAELMNALRRLKGTVIETNIRSRRSDRTEMFGLIEAWSNERDPRTDRSLGMTITLPRWLYDGIVIHRDVLRISPAYFDITSGIGRWLYRIARRHAGRQENGWRFTMVELHRRSGSTQARKDFARDLRKAIKVGVPEYRLDLLRSQTGEEVVSMIRDPAKAELPQRRDLQRLGARSGDGHVGLPADEHVGLPARTRGITRRNRQKPV